MHADAVLYIYLPACSLFVLLQGPLNKVLHLMICIIKTMICYKRQHVIFYNSYRQCFSSQPITIQVENRYEAPVLEGLLHIPLMQEAKP